MIPIPYDNRKMETQLNVLLLEICGIAMRNGVYMGLAFLNQKENEDVAKASIEGKKKDESSSKERDGISIERKKDCCDDKPSSEAEQHGHLYFQFCDTVSPYWRIPFIEKVLMDMVMKIIVMFDN
nr:uncharacterized protein LOC109167854 [Ipomoea batatas]